MSRTVTRRVLFGLVAAAALVAAGVRDARQNQFLVKPAFVPPADAPQFAADRVVVKFTHEVDPLQIDAAFGPMGARWLESGEDHAFDVLKVEPGTVMNWVELLSAMPGVEYAEADPIAWMTSTPNDTYFAPYQWNFLDWGNTSNGYVSNYGVEAQTAWNTTQGANITVAIVDTGVAYENYGAYIEADDLIGATFVSPNDYVNGDAHANDDNGHGTHVCGTIRQQTNNSNGCAGLAYACSIMPVKVLDSTGSGYLSWVADGIRWAADHGAFSINLSLGSSSGSSTLQSAVDYAWGKGCVLCAATGNNGSGTISYPARYTNCMAVGATRFDGKRCSYSQWGTGIDVVAPGGDTSVDQNHDGYGDGILQETFQGSPTSFAYYFFQGTSMATPHATALAAMVESNKPTYSNQKVRDAIQNTCKDLGATGYDTKYGYGLIDAKAAVQY